MSNSSHFHRDFRQKRPLFPSYRRPHSYKNSPQAVTADLVCLQVTLEANHRYETIDPIGFTARRSYQLIAACYSTHTEETSSLYSSRDNMSRLNIVS
jgi:hypothetical protein